MGSRINFIIFSGIILFLIVFKSFSLDIMYIPAIGKEFGVEYRSDTLKTGINHNTTRSNYGNRSRINSDIGVNEPGVNLVHRNGRFRAEAELADRVRKKSMTNMHPSFDVILKNGGSSLAMFENNGYTYLNDNGLLIVHEYPVRLLIQYKGENIPEGEWSLIRSKEQRKSKGLGQVSDILKLKQSKIGKNLQLLEAGKLPPGEYLFVWKPSENKASNRQSNNPEVEFCYEYLPYIETTLELIDIDWDLEICPAPESIASSINISLEVIPGGLYTVLDKNKNINQMRK